MRSLPGFPLCLLIPQHSNESMHRICHTQLGFSLCTCLPTADTSSCIRATRDPCKLHCSGLQTCLARTNILRVTHPLCKEQHFASNALCLGSHAGGHGSYRSPETLAAAHPTNMGLTCYTSTHPQPPSLPHDVLPLSATQLLSNDADLAAAGERAGHQPNPAVCNPPSCQCSALGQAWPSSHFLKAHCSASRLTSPQPHPGTHLARTLPQGAGSLARWRTFWRLLCVWLRLFSA